MRNMAILFVLLLLTLPLHAATILVPHDQPTIQQAIDAAAPGDEVVVADGTWTGPGNVNLDFRGKAITVRSGNGPRQCIIDMEGSARAALFNSGEGHDSVLEGFTLRNGNAPRGGGIMVTAVSSPTISGNVIEYCHADENGGGICVRVSPSVLITGNVIRNNDAVKGGGVWLNNTGAVVTANRFMENSATEEGGGLRCTWSLPELANNLFYMNHAGIAGGAIHLTLPYAYTGTYTIASTTVDENSTDGSGSGLFCRYCEVEIVDSIFTNNSGYDIWIGDDSAAAIVHMDYTGILGSLEQIVHRHPGSVFTYGDHLVNAPPLYSHGPLGDHYLHHTSQYVNAGSDLAPNICFTGRDGAVCMDELTTRASELLDFSSVDLGYHYPLSTGSPRTLWGRVATTPPSGVLPAYARFWLLIRQQSEPPVDRTAAVTIGLRTAGGQYYPNWRSGTATITEGVDYLDVWTMWLPDTWSFTGENQFLLRLVDITPPPYNQSPYQPSGGTAIDAFTFTGISPAGD